MIRDPVDVPAMPFDLSDEELQALLARAADSPRDRLHILHGLLGEPACRQLGIYPIPAGFKLSVVIPVYNERQWIEELIRRVQAVPIPKEIIIVDDCSKDHTRDILRQLEQEADLHIVYQSHNQ